MCIRDRDKEAPITQKITYYLDGKEIAPKDLAGKSGKVTMRFEFTNNEKTTKTIDGKSTDVYVPFSVCLLYTSTRLRRRAGRRSAS